MQFSRVDKNTNKPMTVERYRKDSFVVLSSTFEDPWPLWDPKSAKGILGLNTIYYDYIEVQGCMAYKMIKVSAKWDVKDTTMSLSNATVVWYQEGTGFNYKGQEIGPFMDGDTREIGTPVSGEPYYIYTENSTYVKKVPAFIQAGSQTVHVTRGSKSWDFVLINEMG